MPRPRASGSPELASGAAMTTLERGFAIAAVALAVLFVTVSVGEDTQLGVELDRPFVVPAEKDV